MRFNRSITINIEEQLILAYDRHGKITLLLHTINNIRNNDYKLITFLYLKHVTFMVLPHNVVYEYFSHVTTRKTLFTLSQVTRPGQQKFPIKS